jgi:hypothetical protein
MRTTTLFVVCLLTFLGLTTAACTKDTETTTDGTSPSVSDLPTTDVPPTFVPGQWTYEYLGVRATFEWKDGPATLTVTNGSGHEVGAPALYVVTQDQREVDGTMDAPVPLSDGAKGEYTVTFPGLQPDDAGLIVLLLGDENWGALSPKVVQK